MCKIFYENRGIPCTKKPVRIAPALERKGVKMRLEVDFDNLATAVHAVGGIYAVGRVCATVGGILGQQRSLKAIGTAASGAALLGMFAFRLCHDGKSWMWKNRGKCPPFCRRSRIFPKNADPFLRHLGLKLVAAQADKQRYGWSLASEVYCSTHRPVSPAPRACGAARRWACGCAS